MAGRRAGMNVVVKRISTTLLEKETKKKMKKGSFVFIIIVINRPAKVAAAINWIWEALQVHISMLAATS